jgi:hypothetical protein
MRNVAVVRKTWDSGKIPPALNPSESLSSFVGEFGRRFENCRDWLIRQSDLECRTSVHANPLTLSFT